MIIQYVDYRPLGAARELFRRRDPELILSGPAGTGKSRAVLEKLHWCAEKYAGCRLLMMRKTRKSLTTTGIITYQKHVLPEGSARVTHFGVEYPNGSIIDFGGMDNAAKIMSSEYDIIFVQEATELVEDEWQSLTTRLRWHKLPYQQMLADCNPGPPSHWILRRVASKKLILLESRHEDNPTLWKAGTWTVEGQQYIAKLDALSGALHSRLRLGQWAAAQGMVYATWDPAVHMLDPRPIPPEWPRVWSIDFGYSNPFVCQWWAMSPDGRLIRYREIYRTQRIVEDHCRDIRAVCKANNEPIPVAIICDHDAEDRATFERHMGLLTRPAFKAIRPGIQAVQTRLKQTGDKKPMLWLMRDALVERDEALFEAKMPTCTEEEILSYVWPKTSSKPDKLEVPIKLNDHGCDAMRYLVAAVDDVQHDPSEVQRFEMPPPYQISAI